MTECPYDPRDPCRPCQGAIYRDIIATIVATPATEPPEHVEVSEWTFPYAIAMSQECDLYQDHSGRESLHSVDSPSIEEDSRASHDKLLLNVLMCPGYVASDFRGGKHLARVGRVMSSYTSSQWRSINSNQHPRFHYLAAWGEFQVTEMVIDFKHFFTLPTEQLRGAYAGPDHYIARLRCPYREDLSQRFAAYLARIGLPAPHHRIALAGGS